MTLTLWDLIEPIRKRLKPQVVAPAPNRADQPGQSPTPASRAIAPTRSVPIARPARPVNARIKRKSPTDMQDRYDAVVRLMLDQYQVRVRKWRTSMSGVAWYVEYRDGRRQNLIEAPRPKGPMSAAVFLHEIGHHAIGFNVYKPRCLEEFHAWRWALEAMEAHGLNITDQVRYRMHGSLHYAVQKARRRGIKSIPSELTPFLERPSRPGSRRRR